MKHMVNPGPVRTDMVWKRDLVGGLFTIWTEYTSVTSNGVAIDYFIETKMRYNPLAREVDPESTDQSQMFRFDTRDEAESQWHRLTGEPIRE